MLVCRQINTSGRKKEEIKIYYDLKCRIQKSKACFRLDVSKCLRLKMFSSSRAGRGKKSETSTPTLRTEGMEQSITEVRELKNRDGQVGIGRERKGLGEAVKEGDGRRGSAAAQIKAGTPEKVGPSSTCRCPAANSNTLFRKGTQLNGFCSREPSTGARDCLSRRTREHGREFFQEVVHCRLAVGGGGGSGSPTHADSLPAIHPIRLF